MKTQIKHTITVFALAISGAMMFQACNSGGNQGNSSAMQENQESDRVRTNTAQNQGWDQQKEKEFLSSAHMINLEEIKAGELAQQKAQDQQVQEYGQALKDHHQKNKQKLENLAQQKNVQLPQDLSSEKKQKVQKLESAQPDQFEKEFLSTMVKGHEDAVRKFEEAEKNVADEELKNYISETLPTLREHLEKAQSLQSK